MKIIKRILLGLVVLLGISATAIYFYKDTLIKQIVSDFNKNYNITVAYESTGLSFFKQFPNTSVSINDLSVINDESNDTLFVSNKMYVALSITDLFKNIDEKIVVKNLLIANAKIHLFSDENGKTNYDVKNVSETNTPVDEGKATIDSSEPLKISIEKYAFNNIDVLFEDRKSEIKVDLKNLNHSGKGVFKGAQIDLDTKTNIDSLTVGFAKVNYFNKTRISLDAILGMDLDKMKFVFKENSAKINDLVLQFDGSIQMNDTDQTYDISFNAPDINFKSILSLVPSAYSSDFSGVSASGNASMNGVFKGILSETEFPKYDVHIKTDNATFKYPDLPKSVSDIHFDGRIASTTTDNDTFLDIKKLKFRIDKDQFATHGKITHLTTNPTVDATFNGTLNLANLTKAYPIAMEEKLEGVLKANFTTQADQKSIENNKFGKINTNGTASLEEFSYAGEDMANPIHIKNAAIKFNTNSILLSDFNATTGKSDINAAGKLDNLYAFLFNEKDLQGNFHVSSNNFIVSDFLVEETEEKIDTAKETNSEINNAIKTPEALKIPDFLDINTSFKATKVVYDNITLKNVAGQIKINKQKVTLHNTKANMLDGKITLNGDIDTKHTPARFDLDMDIDKFDIANSFQTVETFQKIVPIAKALKGKYTTKFRLKGNLDKDFLPEINSLSGNAFSQLFVKNIDKKSLLVSSLSSNIDFINFDKINLEKIKAAFSFENGKVAVKPFSIKYEDIVMQISGSHGFDTSLEYNIKMDVPAKYLGKEAVNLLAKLSNTDQNLKIPLSTVIKGTLTKPSVKVNTKQAMTQLTKQIVAQQKQKLTEQATNKVSDLLGGIINNGTKKDSTSTKKDAIKEGVSGLINLFGKKKKK